MPTINTTITLTADEIKEIIKKALKLEGNYQIDWSLKSLPAGKYDDFRDGGGQTVGSATLTLKSPKK